VKSEVLEEITVHLPIRSLKSKHGIEWDRISASAVGSQRWTAWTM